MTDVSILERCISCGRPTELRCDQCGSFLCLSHRVVVEGELGRWSRCERCNTRNKIRENLLIRYWRWEMEARLFLRLFWLLTLASALFVVILYRLS